MSNKIQPSDSMEQVISKVVGAAIDAVQPSIDSTGISDMLVQMGHRLSEEYAARCDTPSRFPIQITACGHDNTSQTQNSHTLHALCNDGSMWELKRVTWRRLPDIPSVCSCHGPKPKKKPVTKKKDRPAAQNNLLDAMGYTQRSECCSMCLHFHPNPTDAPTCRLNPACAIGLVDGNGRCAHFFQEEED